MVCYNFAEYKRYREIEGVFVVKSIRKTSPSTHVTEDSCFKKIGFEPTGIEGTVSKVLDSTIIYDEHELIKHREFERYRQDALDFQVYIIFLLR